jgi:hypothetical protein
VDHPEGCQSQASCWCCCGSRAHVGRLLLRKHVVLHCVLLTALLLGTIPSLYCAVLCCAVLCCAVLCCAVLCCAVLCCAVLCCAVLCCYLHECAEAKGALAIFTGNRALWSDALALWVQVRRYVFNSKEH